MSRTWRWEYDPEAAHVTANIPIDVVTEVERLADQLVELAAMGVDLSDIGDGLAPEVCGA